MCTQGKFQVRLVQLFSTAMSSIRTVIDVAVPNWSGLESFNKAVDTATTVLNTWQDGTPITQVVQAIDAVIAVVTSLNGVIPSQYVVVIDVALAGLKSVIVLLQEHNPTPTHATEEAFATVATKYDMPEYPLYSTAKQYKHAWNNALKPFPELDSAKM